ncbi:hypothetical protein J5U23_01678 [Saccharolobus shibatae B12]|uniref:Uncharacterized protein n=1 Tax=Saccharolobus shibatae (strain ATCC 51178 / DSM 5389 / JCM 8931 / NBRC 15437 / B12) TaxID=523848 RepID=A0A8F5BP67_SACSH|nr:hypothetical protein J5U23_01678 [Saccharolobus shibatae B12]
MIGKRILLGKTGFSLIYKSLLLFIILFKYCDKHSTNEVANTKRG